ncbi:MAG: tetratricopeptide repeat protein [Actinobacteria bacterium]|nr:tetratricopeptide repeat protein [Actinomycetota bacterium]
MTDVEGSTRLWEAHSVEMSLALARLDDLIRESVGSCGGVIIKTRGEGDSAFTVFRSASDAVSCALKLQGSLLSEEWPGGLAIRVRMSLHTGVAELRGNDYYGRDVNRTARLRDVAHGGQIIASQAVRDSVQNRVPGGGSFIDLGLHYLRDLERPEHLYQLSRPGLPDKFPAVRRLESRSTNLPLQLTSFVGRHQELQEVADLLSGTRLLSLTGSGGCGKTRLALELGARVAGDYPDGVFVVELGALNDSALVIQTALGALSIREEGRTDAFEALANFLLGKNLLLILDNCEHVLEACADLADRLLRVRPDLCVLTTSRQPLNVPGETTYRVPSLPVPDPQSSPSVDDLMRFESVRLFVDRAAHVDSAFSLSTENADAVARICFHLDGIPLAIELAAARIRAFSPQTIAERLDHRFTFLTGGSRTALPRQQTLKALVDWSYDHLDDEERTLLRRLSVFAGGFSLESVEGVCLGDELRPGSHIELVSALVDKSIVVFEERSDGARYSLLETIRDYSGDRLEESGEVEVTRDSHLEWFLSLAERSEPDVTTSEWLQTMEVEHDNLRAALQWAIGRGFADAALRLTGALARLWTTHGHLSEGRRWLEEALASGTEPAPAVRAKALNAAGALAWMQGDHDAAITKYEEALALRRNLDDAAGIAATLANLGIVSYSQGQYGQARSRYGESLKIWREIGDPQGVARSLDNLGNLAQEEGDYLEAQRLYEESIEISRRLQDKWLIARSLNNLGEVALLRGDLVLARKTFDEDLELSRELGDKWVMGRALNNCAEIDRLQGDLGAAKKLFEQSLDLSRELGDKQSSASSLGGLAEVAREDGDHERAISLHRESLRVRQELDDKPGIAGSLEGFGSVLADVGRFQTGVRLLAAAETLRESIGSPLPPVAIKEHERIVHKLRTALDPDSFRSLWNQGREMSEEEAAELVFLV